MIESIFWQVASILIILPAFLGVYLLASSSDQLTVRYQNYMLAKTMKPLKDEDFKNIKKIIFGLKMLGLILLVGSLAIGANIMGLA